MTLDLNIQNRRVNKAQKSAEPRKNLKQAEIFTIVLQVCQQQHIQNPLESAQGKMSYGGLKFGILGGPPTTMNSCLPCLGHVIYQLICLFGC